jgi:hypothetical protein
MTAKSIMLKEQLLHFIWQHKLFNTKDLRTSDGLSLQIIDFGKYNKDGGPDFVNARILLDGIILAGNIELHVHASDWLLHKHQNDRKYNSVILHAVYVNDVMLEMPTLELNGRISSILIEKYESMMLSRDELICRHMIHTVDAFTLDNWRERLVIERLEHKAESILFNLSANNNDWEQTCYQLCARCFGSPVNKEPFEMLAQLLHYKILRKHSESKFQTEALLFGTAGLLEMDFEEEYPVALKKEYNYLKHKYKLQRLEMHQWQLLRMRPVAFPAIRLAWFAKLMRKMPLFDKIIGSEYADDLLCDIEASAYWKTHYVFDKQSKYNSKFLGNAFRDLLRINFFAPLLYAYGRSKDEEKYIEKAFAWLQETPAEQNAKTKLFNKSLEMSHAFHTQAVIELYDHYCTRKRCLECSIGNKILR